MFDIKINEKNVLVNGIIVGFHPVEKKINWQATNAGFAHLSFLLDFLVRAHNIQADKFQFEFQGLTACICDLESTQTFELAGPVFSKQEASSTG